MPYSTLTYVDEYNALENYDTLSFGPNWDVPMEQLYLPFEFPCFSDTAAEIWLSDAGGSLELRMPDNNTHLISATNADLNDVLNILSPDSNEGSTHRFTTVGSSPNRIFKFEFNNVGFDFEMSVSVTANLTANFQIWLYENGDIELRYGPHNISSLNDISFWPNNSAGLSSYWDFFDFTANFLWANGDSSAPLYPLYEDVEYDSLQIDPAFTGLSNWPDSGTVYHFGYDNPASINSYSLHKQAFIISPNPASDRVLFEFENDYPQVIDIYDITGKIILTETASSNSTIDISNLINGIYIIKTQNGYAKRLVKE